MQIVVLTDDPRLLVRPDKIERRVKSVEERRMIAVANILHIELPVPMNILSGGTQELDRLVEDAVDPGQHALAQRSEEHTSELQSLMRISYAVFCLKKKNKIKQQR